MQYLALYFFHRTKNFCTCSKSAKYGGVTKKVIFVVFLLINDILLSRRKRVIYNKKRQVKTMKTKTSSFTVKMDTLIKTEIKDYCDKEGYVFSKFIENAAKHKLEEIQRNEDLLIYAKYMANEKGTGIDFDAFMESVGVKPEHKTAREQLCAVRGVSKKGGFVRHGQTA
jgi:hypothetical protein